MELKAEFPDFAAPQLLSCFDVGTDAGCAQLREAQLTQILRQMQWSVLEEAECLQQYRQEYNKVVARAAKEKLGNADAWGRCMRDAPECKQLWKLLMIVLSLLVTETDCERNFAWDKRNGAFDRGNLASVTRSQCLKVRLDGLNLDELIDREGKPGEIVPRNNFLQWVQKRYVKKFGSKKMGNVARRKDAGKKLVRKRKRGGRETVTHFQFKRRQVMGRVSCAPPELAEG
jgi:hypothetical protein